MTGGPDQTKSKPDCVLIDANIWRSQCLLKSNEGEALVYILNRQRGVIGLPETIEREMAEHAVEAGQKAASVVFLKWLDILSALYAFFSDRPTGLDLFELLPRPLHFLHYFFHRRGPHEGS